jgi:hypothetical protein
MAVVFDARQMRSPCGLLGMKSDLVACTVPRSGPPGQSRWCQRTRPPRRQISDGRSPGGHRRSRAPPAAKCGDFSLRKAHCDGTSFPAAACAKTSPSRRGASEASAFRQRLGETMAPCLVESRRPWGALGKTAGRVAERHDQFLTSVCAPCAARARFTDRNSPQRALLDAPRGS